ncbi:MAG: hypothetical protein R2851_08205 [Caldilineaceae bacterium]
MTKIWMLRDASQERSQQNARSSRMKRHLRLFQADQERFLTTLPDVGLEDCQQHT